MRGLGWATVVAIGMAGLASPAAGAGYKVEIVRTKYGVPHVIAADYASLGYGQAYAFAQDNLCLLADKIVTVRGERSKHFGPEATNVVSFQDIKNLESDFFFKGHIDIAALRASFAAASPDYQALVTGYVAGFNRFLKDTPAGKLPVACDGKPWLGLISVDDMLRLNEERMVQASGGAWLRQTNAAAPPTATSGDKSETCRKLSPCEAVQSRADRTEDTAATTGDKTATCLFLSLDHAGATATQH